MTQSNYDLARAVEYGKSQCARGGSESAVLDAQLVLQHVLQCDRQWLFMHSEKRLSEEQWNRYRHLISRRRKGEPVAYILGESEFWSLPLAVNNSTLIPRPDTERLVEAALELPLAADARVLELGTGTGAIALALASEKAHWSVDAVDKQPQAVELALANRDSLGLMHVNIFVSNWFNKISHRDYDLIVSNPPYIDANDHHLNTGDVQFEPRTALIADSEGYGDIKQIITQSPDYIVDGGWVMLEHGYQQASKVRDIFRERGYKKVSTLSDYASLDRVTYAQCNR